MKLLGPVEPPLALPENYWAVLRFLFEAFPLPVPCDTVTRALLCRPGGSPATAEKRGWRILSALRARALIAATPAPTITGRPPLHWYPLGAGIEALVATGRATPAEVKAKPRIHKSLQRLLARRHDLFVQDVKSSLLLLTATDTRVLVESYCHDRTGWVLARDAAGVEHSVAPDLAARLVVGGSPVVLFVEVQGTAAPLSCTVEKAVAYVALLRSGLCERLHGTRNVRLAFVTFSDDPSGGEDHRNNVLATLAGIGTVDRIAHVATVADVVKHGLNGPIWLRPLEYKAHLATLPPRVQERFVDVAHAGNAIRKERDDLVRTHMAHVRIFG